jgi:hypothetical protein
MPLLPEKEFGIAMFKWETFGPMPKRRRGEGRNFIRMKDVSVFNRRMISG